MVVKSEKLKKLEAELHDLEQWLKLGLVPKKDIEKHKTEMIALKERIEEEKERIRFLKESGAMEEYAAPKKTHPPRQAYSDTASMPDIEIAEESASTDAGLDMESESFDAESESGEETTAAGASSAGEEEEEAAEEEEEEDEDPFSDRNRLKRGVMEDPESDNW